MPVIKDFISKFLTSIIMVVAIIAVLIFIILVPFSNIGDIRPELNTLEKKYQSLKKIAVDEATLLKDFDEARKELSAFDVKFPPDIEQENTLLVVQDLELGSGLNVTAMKYEVLQFDTLNQPLTEAPKSASSSATRGVQPPVPGKGMKMPIKTQFLSDYTQLKEFVKMINETEQRIGLREIKMSMDKNQMIKGSVILEFYGFMPEAVKEAEVKK